MNEDRIRADVALAQRGLAPSRERAQALIAAGLVRLNGAIVQKPSQKAGDNDVLTVAGADHPYVGRGGLKLAKALEAFDVDPAGKVCMDVGASTGGFTDVLLRHGARKVYAIDVGSGQLDPSLIADARVVNMEQTNARELSRDCFDAPPTLAVMDVSFISIRLILPALFDILGDAGEVVSLVKPQFEAGRQAVGKRGIVGKPDIHVRVLRDIVAFAPTHGWVVDAMAFSPVTGGDGNIEFLAHLLPSSRATKTVSLDEIDAVVREAHRSLEHKR